MPWRSTQSSGLERRFFDYTPASFRPGSPVIIALHGGGGSVFGFIGQADLKAISNRYGLRFILPEGLYDTWNVGDGQGQAEAAGVDDVQFLQDIIDQENLGPEVVLVGMSKGGMLALKAASELHGVTAHVGAIAATLIDQSPDGLVGSRVVMINGADDDRVPMEGDQTTKRPPVLSGLMQIVDGNLNPHDLNNIEEEAVPDGTIYRIRSTKDALVWGTLYEVAGGVHEVDVSKRVNEFEFILGELGIA